jgi:predicted lipoprotein
VKRCGVTVNRALLTLAWLALTSCGPVSAPETDARRLLMKGLGEEVWIPNYVEFEERLDDLTGAIKSLCKRPDVDSLTSAQLAWSASRAPWKRNELLGFGPTVDLPLRAGPNIDFWPARTATIDAVIEEETDLSAKVLSERGTAERGLPVMEYLLFTGDGEPEDLFVRSGRRCEYLLALSEDTKAQATALREAWDPEHGDYLSNLVGAGRAGKDFDSIEAALGEVVSRLAFIIENVRGDKLANVLGTRSGGTPQPDSAESRFSGRGLEDMRDNLAGVEQVFFGVKRNGQSLARYLDSIGHKELRSKLKDALEQSYSALGAIPSPLGQAVIDDPASVQGAIDTLAELQTLIQSDTINALGVTLTFNDADGD